jgi:hypothetical protein
MMANPMGNGAAQPWGWWLRVSGRVLQDAEGREWRSVRDAFWQGKLNFPATNGADEYQELLLRALTAIDNRGLNGAENTYDLFDGDMHSWHFYTNWLSSVDLIERINGTSPVEAALSDLDRSVMFMLQATREPDWVDLPMASVIDAIRLQEWGGADDGREEVLRLFEREVARRPYVFARERVHRLHLITLTGIGVGARMPVRRVMWSRSFADERARDDFFAWLAQRVDRWDAWGGLAYSKGSTALTEHFFSLIVEGGQLRP